MVACVAALLLLAGVAAVHAADADAGQNPEGAPGQCYVCVSRDWETAEYVRSRHNTSIELCDKFKPDDSRFIRTCQPPFLGCLTTMNGKQITRQCSEDSWEECHNLNGVHYCYCQTPLCNGNLDETYAELASLRDDDDYPSIFEGSGGEETDEDDDDDDGNIEYTYAPVETTEPEEMSLGFAIYPSMAVCIYLNLAAAIFR